MFIKEIIYQKHEANWKTQSLHHQRKPSINFFAQTQNLQQKWRSKHVKHLKSPIQLKKIPKRESLEYMKKMWKPESFQYSQNWKFSVKSMMRNRKIEENFEASAKRCGVRYKETKHFFDENWSTLKYDDGKSLARVLHEEEGWTSNMLDEVAFIWKIIFFIIFDWAYCLYFWQSFSAMEISAHHWSKVNPGFNERY